MDPVHEYGECDEYGEYCKHENRPFLLYISRTKYISTQFLTENLNMTLKLKEKNLNIGKSAIRCHMNLGIDFTYFYTSF